MVGFFKSWSVSGITTKAAQNSAEQYRIGTYLKSIDLYKTEIDSETKNLVNVEIKTIIKEKKEFDDYILRGNNQKHDKAVEFLVMIAAIMYGAEDRDWDWKAIRQFSQGLYGSMVDTPQIFKIQNLPVIEDVIESINLLIE